MNAANVETRRKRRLDPTDGRDELNLAEFPIALLAERVPDGQKTLEFQDTIRDQKTGDIVTRKLTISASDKYGLPTAKDDEVILGLVQLTRLTNNFTDREVRFSRRDVIHLLGWPYSGQSFRRVEESLKRWLGVTLYYEKAWWNNKAQAWVDENFHIVERVSLCDAARVSGDAQRELPLSSFTWSEVIFHSFQASYLKRLDLDFYLGLTSATAKRVYRFLDKRFYHGPRWEFDLDEFAFEHVGLSRTYHTGKIKEKLAPAIAELEAKGFLEPLPPAERYAQIRRGEWKIVFLRKAKAGAIPAEPPTPQAPQGLEKELVTRGVTSTTAAELVAAHPAERIESKIEVFDWMTEKKDKRLSQNPAGYLVASIRDDYAAPKDFEPRAERERKRQSAAEGKRREQERRAAERQQEQQAAAARKAEREHIDRYLKELTPQQRKALEEQAIANADDTMRAAARDGSPMGEIARRLLVDREVLRVCPLPTTCP